MLSTLYAAAARRRREWYAARPQARQRLRHPVISIGNIASGGRGKTPFAAATARLLLELGERPAILSRGYRRTSTADKLVVVRDADGLRADVARAGDEPFMLARQLPGAIVVVSADRYAAGRFAEERLGATVHVLDDGFQHHRLDRDVDIVLVSPRDVTGAETFPAGRLREPADVLVAADAIVAVDDDDEIVEATRPDAPLYRARRTAGAAVFEGGSAPGTGIVLALAGIAEPRAFIASLEALGWTVAAEHVVADHHPYSRPELETIVAAARRAGAGAILTTEKDFVRLLPLRPFPLPVGFVPLTMEPEPRDAFRAWLASAMASARDIVVA